MLMKRKNLTLVKLLMKPNDILIFHRPGALLYMKSCGTDKCITVAHLKFAFVIMRASFSTNEQVALMGFQPRQLQHHANIQFPTPTTGRTEQPGCLPRKAPRCVCRRDDAQRETSAASLHTLNACAVSLT